MKKIFLLVAITCFASHSFAQLGNLKSTLEQRAQQAVDLLDKTVKLSPAQKAKVYALSMKYLGKMNGTKDITQAANKSIVKDIQSIDQQKDAELKEILSPEQYTTYLASKKQGVDNVQDKLKSFKP